jgi:thiamine-monophosphate kinase
MRLSQLGEFGLIARLERILAQAGATPAAGAVSLGIGDDAALLRPPAGTEIVATIDAVMEEVHFRRDWSKPEDVGWKALAVNVSDLNGMGARPLAALVSIGLPPDVTPAWIERCYRGLAECAAAYGCPLVGGDTVRSPRHIAISVTAIGTVAEGQAVLRSGAQPGDLLCVTGVLGQSAAGYELLAREVRRRPEHAPLLAAHRRPHPPRLAGAVLAEAGLATAMLDLSDGLASDLQHLSQRSGVGVTVEATRLPISDATRQTAKRLELDATTLALHGGEDYELLFTVPPDHWEQAPPALGPLGVVATIIGRVEAAKGPRGVGMIGADERRQPLRPQGFSHFAG